MTDKASPEQFSALLAARYSCRGFLPRPVPDSVITRMVTTAQQVPSWCNAQPWQVVITRGQATEEIRDKLMQAAMSLPMQHEITVPGKYEGIYKQRRSDCGWQLYGAVGVTKGDRAGSGQQMLENFRLFGAPHLAIVTTEAILGAYGVLDCGAFITAFMLAAEAEGVASIAQAAIAGYSSVVRPHFGIAANRQIVCGISFGYPDPDHPANQFRTPRADVAEVIDWR